MQVHSSFSIVLGAMPFFLLGGCGGGSSSASSNAPVAGATRSITLASARDPWPLARERFMDIDDAPFSDAFARSFSYRNARVVLKYEAAPETGFFSGAISARGLKPNFAYQIKLAGKPVSGSRGWGQAGDDFSNEALGRAGRWWNDSNTSRNTNNDDAVFEQLYKNAPAAQKQTVYGYLFLGNIVTDQNGDAEQNFSANSSYHITWQDKQGGSKDVLAGTYQLQSAAPLYAYATPIRAKTVRLWHELEAGRAQPVRLPVGDYNCRLLLTEETFHSFDSAGKGGLWPTVLGTEDLNQQNQPDRDATNDVRFRIGN